MTHRCAPLGRSAVMVVRECVGAAGRSGEFGRAQHFQIAVPAICDAPVGVGLSDRARREELYGRVLLAHERLEYLEVTPERGRVISLWRTAHRRQRRFVEILRRSD